MKRCLLLLMFMLSPTAFGEGERFLFVTFKGEQTPQTEQIYLAVSQDGRDWEALKQGKPVLVSDLGEKGVRDPYLVRSQDGKRYFLLATDLSINLTKHDWGRASRAGSRAVIIWESEDLKTWSKPRRVVVAADDAGCTWAPEAIYDAESQDYLVFWASLNRSDDYAKFRIWASRTKDFKTFSKPFVYIDEPHPVIDTTIIQENGKFYRFCKNEKDKLTTLEVSDNLMGRWAKVDGYSLTALQGVEGPECYQLRPATATKPAQWCLILDHYGSGQGYKAFVTEDLASGRFDPMPDMKFPFKFRHGSVLRITDGEYKQLEQAFPKSPQK